MQRMDQSVQQRASDLRLLENPDATKEAPILLGDKNVFLRMKPWMPEIFC